MTEQVRLIVAGDALQHLAQRLGAGLRGFLDAGAGASRHLLDDRVECGVGVILRAEIFEHAPFVGDRVAQLLGEPRLADSGLARDGDDLSVTALGAVPASDEPRHLALAADEIAQAAQVERIELACELLRSNNVPRRHRLREALGLVEAEIGEDEQAPGQLSREIGNDDGVWLGEALQAHREMQSIADDRGLVRGANVDRHQAGCDADAHAQRLSGRKRNLSQGVDDVESDADRALGLVAARLRVAEKDERAVAAHFRDVSAEAIDVSAAAAGEGADDRLIFLRVERRRKLGRTDDVAEQGRELPPLAVEGRGTGSGQAQ